MKIIPINPPNFILPENSFPIIFLQPFLNIDKKGKIASSLIDQQKRKILKTLDIGLNFFKYNLDGFTNSNFIIFPEYSVTLEGFKIIKHKLKKNKNNNIIIIGGLDSLNPQEYSDLENESIFAGKKIDPQKLKNYWINTCFIFFKDSTGKISLYLQPKLSPSPYESGMFSNDEFLYLWSIRRENVNRPFIFFVSICFDLIADQSSGVKKVLEIMDTNAVGTVNLDMIINIQRNDGIFTDAFRGGLRDIFDRGKYNNIERGSAALFMINNAQSENPSKGIGDRQFGNSSVIFPQEFRLHEHYKKREDFHGNPTFTFDPPIDDQTRRYLRHTDVKVMVFREKGDSIHSLIYKPIATLGRTSPYPEPIAPEKARVFSTWNKSNTDNRNNGNPVFCCTKWFLDELDDFSTNNFPAFTGRINNFQTIKDNITNFLKTLKEQDDYYCIMDNSYYYDCLNLSGNADSWDKLNSNNQFSCVEAFWHYFRCLLLLKVAFKDELTPDAKIFHGKIGNTIFYFARGKAIIDIHKKIKEIISRSVLTNTQAIFEGRETQVYEIVCIYDTDFYDVNDTVENFNIGTQQVTLKQFSHASFIRMVNSFDENNFKINFIAKLATL